MVLRVQDHVQGLLQALKFNFPSKMPDLDAYVSSYATFRRFPRFWKVVNPFFYDLGFLFFDFETWEGFFACIGRGSLSWIWIGRVSFVEKLNFQAVIKSAASAASPKTKIQESRGASGRRLGWRATASGGSHATPKPSGRLR